MRNLGSLALGLLLWQSAAPAQTQYSATALAKALKADTPATGVVGSAGSATTREYVPLTTSERWRRYFLGAFGPGAILTSAASGGIRQWENSPKEWGGGAKAFGERFGNSMAEHVMRETLEFGASAALHEDNRYFRSTDTGFWRRTKHAVASTFVAHNNAGGTHFAYSRFGSAAGTAFISRIWQPRSANSAGDGAANFGTAIGLDVGLNFVREFLPRGVTKHFKQ
jgi:hypothetical protein